MNHHFVIPDSSSWRFDPLIKRVILLLTLLCGIQLTVFSQARSINLDLIQSKLNNGRELPAEEEFVIIGAIPDKIELVKLTVNPSDKSSSTAKSYFWKAPFGYQELSYQVLVSEPLRSNKYYRLEFGYYQKAGAAQIEEVRKLIAQNIKSYLSTLTVIKRSGIHFSESDEVILAQLEMIVEKGSYYFELPNGQPFPGFSDLTRAKLRQRQEIKLSKASLNTEGLSATDDPRGAYAAKYLGELFATIEAELGQYLSPNMLVRVDEKIFPSYPTEKTANLIPINFGYGAISLSKNLPQQEFVASPYVGVSFPLGNKQFSPVLGNLSLSTGFFVSGGMENSLGESISGPIINRPIYLGLGYNFFRFIRLNAGGTFLTTELGDGSNQGSFNPFFGVSAEFNLWLGLGKKK